MIKYGDELEHEDKIKEVENEEFPDEIQELNEDPTNEGIKITQLDSGKKVSDEAVNRVNNKRPGEKKAENKLETSQLPLLENVYSDYNEDEFSPLDLFGQIFSKEIIEMIRDNTNKYMRKKTMKKHSEFTFDEITCYFLINIYFSIYKFPEIKMYWEDSSYISTCLSKIISYSRFTILSQYFHISDIDNDNRVENPMCLIEDFLSYLNKTFLAKNKFSSFLTIDECMASFQGRIILKQYMKMKKRKWGIKFFALTDSLTSYVYKLVPYTGKLFVYDKQMGIGPSVANEFTSLQIPEKVHITFDSFFTSMSFIKELDQKDIKFTSTFLACRKGFENFKNVKLDSGEVYCETKDENIKIIAFQDKRTVFACSNAYGEHKIKYLNRRGRRKVVPEMIYIYNKTKCGVDGVDQICSIYSSKRKTYKWWKAVFYYLLDICISNLSILFFKQQSTKELNINSKMLYFRKNLCDTFFTNFMSIHKLISFGHYPQRIEKKKECRRCQKARAKGQKHVSQTKFACSGCKQPLCIECFEEFHTIEKRKKK